MGSKAYLAIMIAVFSLFSIMFWERWLYPKGGVFCPVLHTSYVSSERNICFSSGVSLNVTTVKHLGRENMYLIKFGDQIFGTCFWVNGYRFNMTVDGRDLLRQRACSSKKQILKIELKGEHNDRLQ